MDAASQDRLSELDSTVAELEREFADLDEVLKSEKLALHGTQQIRESLEQARLDLETARRGGDLTRMSELQYGRIPELEKQLGETDQLDPMALKLLRNKVGEEEVAEVVSKWTGIPVSRMLEGEREKLLNLETELHRQVIGQDEAVSAVANAVRRSRAGISDPDRPNGSFLFLGPTGVGKTELCKTLARFLFDTEDALVRIDMSEFMEKHSVARLIGAPPGYVGYEAGGYLTELVRRKPYSVILLDEIEKAHQDVFNILLQVLDDGRLTDGHGRTVDFKNTVLVMTSNLGSDLIQATSGEVTYDEMREGVMGVVTQHFRPEFLNRIDDAVVFHPLNRDEIARIARLVLQTLQARLAEHGVCIKLDDAAMSLLVEAAYDPVYGARPLRRAIQTHLENPLAEAMLSGQFADSDHIQVNARDGKLIFGDMVTGDVSNA